MSQARYVALASLVALVTLVLAWEVWLAPAAGSRTFWLALKLGPLLLSLYMLARGGTRAYLAVALLVLLYVVEGVVVTVDGWRRETAPAGLVLYGALEAVLAVTFFVSAVLHVRFMSRPQARV